MILDPTEISRLTAAPNMQHIWVTGNPFTRSHATTYRINIFNFFRETPGFTEDIMVDGSLPGVMERRHLIDRVFEKAPRPPSSQRLQSPPPLLGHGHARQEGHSPSKVGETQTMGRSTRKKKPNRQRIVSLDDVGTPPPQTQNDTADGVPLTPRVDISGEEYRRRLEALREEAGTGWLKVFSESGGLTENGGLETGNRG
jgi:hypothetical protein